MWYFRSLILRLNNNSVIIFFSYFFLYFIFFSSTLFTNWGNIIHIDNYKYLFTSMVLTHELNFDGQCYHSMSYRLFCPRPLDFNNFFFTLNSSSSLMSTCFRLVKWSLYLFVKIVFKSVYGQFSSWPSIRYYKHLPDHFSSYSRRYVSNMLMYTWSSTLDV